jgi:hypothetical protein
MRRSASATETRRSSVSITRKRSIDSGLCASSAIKAAKRIAAAAAHAPRMVELRQPETLGVLDYHDRSVGHVDADLDHAWWRRARVDRRLEAAHDCVLLVGLHAPVQ